MKKKNILSALGLDRRGLLNLVILGVNAQLIYAFVDSRLSLSTPFLGGLHIDIAQFGILLGLQGFTICAGAIPLGWLGDRLSMKTILGTGCCVTGLIGCFISIFSMFHHISFPCLFILFFFYYLFCEPVYWPTMLKAVRVTTSAKNQAMVFGWWECMRGFSAFIIEGLIDVAIYKFTGSIYAVMVFNSVVTVTVGLLVLFGIPKEYFQKDVAKDTKVALKGVVKAMKLPEVWLTGLGAFCVYTSVSAATNYFLLFLNNVFVVSVTMAAVFGIVSNSVFRTICAPVSGMVTHWKFKTTAHWMRICFITLTIAVGIVYFVIPKQPEYAFFAVIFLSLIFIACFLMRGIYYSPIGEMNISHEMSAAAMSVASTIGYMPQCLAPVVFGAMINRYVKADAAGHVPDPSVAQIGYNRMLLIMFILSAAGIVSTTILGNRIIKRRQENKAAEA
ncbi:MAG: MFS transporter [Spirochaetaceae bacterium]|jgi:MFS family permease|nr:MFS transporter [Spirochaetaceae bacterium]